MRPKRNLRGESGCLKVAHLMREFCNDFRRTCAKFTRQHQGLQHTKRIRDIPCTIEVDALIPHLTIRHRRSLRRMRKPRPENGQQ